MHKPNPRKGGGSTVLTRSLLMCRHHEVAAHDVGRRCEHALAATPIHTPARRRRRHGVSPAAWKRALVCTGCTLQREPLAAAWGGGAHSTHIAHTSERGDVRQSRARAPSVATTRPRLLVEQQQHQANLHAAVVQRLLVSELAAKLKAQLEEARREASDAAGAAASRDEEAVVRCVAADARPPRCG